MELQQALKVLAANRGDNVVVTTMAAIGEWFQLSNTPLDFAYMPSSMGQGPGLGLGIALAQNRHGVVVVNGDGSMLMNLGSLVTLASHPASLYLVIMDNQMYEITGGQPTVGAGKVDFAELARGAGIKRVYHFETLDDWRQHAGEALSGPGPVVIWLRIAGRLGQQTPKPPRPMAEQLERLKGVLSTSNASQ
jgi:thiamine pyrophosphate-dependent acetolactate synthase large subunit-like protein